MYQKMYKKRALHLAVLGMLVASLLAACGDTPTATTQPTTAATSATTAATSATTAATATTAAASATTAAATTAAGTATTAAPAATTAATSATTAAGTATTAAATTSNAQADAAGIFPLEKLGGGQKGGDLKIVSLTKQLVPDLHPYPQNVNYTSSWTDIATYLFGMTLVEYDAFNLRWRYGAAEKLVISPDNKTFTFTLRPGLKWSDGSAVVVEDFIYPVEQASKEDPNPDNNYVSIDNLEKIASYKAEGSNTIICTLKEVAPKNLALSYCGTQLPVKKSLWEKYPFYDNQKNPEILTPTVVSGPYKLKTFKLDEQIVLETNANYFRGESNITNLTFVPSAQPSNAYESVKGGQNNYAPDINPAQAEDARKNTNIQYFEWASANGGYRSIEFNLGRAPLNDIAMRKAIAHSIDRQALLKAADSGLGVLSDSFVNPSDKNFYNPNVTKYNLDLNKARQILKDAGYVQEGETLKDKTGKVVEMTVVYPTSSTARKLQATYLQQQLKQLGIKINVDGQEFNAYVAKVNAEDYDISLANFGGGIPPDPNGVKSQFITKANGGTQNRKGYSNKRVDELFLKGETEPNDTKRAEYYKEIQQIISDELPVYYLYTLTDYSVVSKNVSGAKPNLLDRLYWDNAISNWVMQAK